MLGRPQRQPLRVRDCPVFGRDQATAHWLQTLSAMHLSTNAEIRSFSHVSVIDARLAEAQGVVRDVALRLGGDAAVRRLLERGQAWCVLVGFYLAALEESWGPNVPADELTRVGSHAAERYLSTVGGALCGVLRAPGARADTVQAAAVHEIRDALMRVLDALLHP